MTESKKQISLVAGHNGHCEKAGYPDCECNKCYGMLHQYDILRQVVSANSCGSTLQGLLNDLFGLRFDTLEGPPNSVKDCRRRKWDTYTHQNGSVHSGLPAGMKSQVEQRIVDVTLHDLLFFTASTSVSKMHWIDFLEAITKIPQELPQNGNGSSIAETLNSDPDDRTNGYFWSSILAMMSSHISSHRGCSIDSQVSRDSVLRRYRSVEQNSYNFSPFNMACYPRGKSGSSLKRINMLDDVQNVCRSIDYISQVWNGFRRKLFPLERHFVLCLTGVAVSPDLWRHPQAVKHLLLPCIDMLRNDVLGSGLSFSLDADSQANRVEYEINDRLARTWKTGSYW